MDRGELRELATENAFGRLADETYLKANPRLLAELDDARRPNASTACVEPAQPVSYLDDLVAVGDRAPGLARAASADARDDTPLRARATCGRRRG
jgi:hypothetical protein